MRTLRYCSTCGKPLTSELIDNYPRLVCTSCNHVHYINPIPSVVALIERQGSVLLVKRAVEPGKGNWCLPGGFIESGETITTAALREIKEETNLKCRILDIWDACSDLEGFYGDVLVVCYRAEILGGELKAGDDAIDLGFFEEDNLPRLAFRCHARFLAKFWGQNDDSVLYG
ncbi:NUDIX hydrolase [bacterium]|nr:NUDIX hydrolase [bacterium]